jgi:twitching motility protein PilT
VVTIEDPVEYQHTNRSSMIEQIEVGRDTPDFAGHAAQHHAAIARRDPGGRNARCRNHGHRAHRRRNRPPGALHAAHQRHHSIGLAHSRFVPFAANQPQMRQQVSLALLAVIAQQLVPGVDGARWPAPKS